jgi:hypothetical protein
VWVAIFEVYVFVAVFMHFIDIVWESSLGTFIFASSWPLSSSDVFRKLYVFEIPYFCRENETC